MTDSPPYPAVAVANFFIEAALDDPDVEPLTQMKLQKLVYISHGWHLARHGEPLIKEPVEAWRFGPVIRDLYSRAREYGSRPIPKPLNGSKSREEPDVIRIPSSDERTLNFLRSVWNSYKGFNAVQLSAMTHREDTPWHEVWDQDSGQLRGSTRITSDSIRSHYERLWNERS
jgi:uncharacterized phage-associated protein